MIESLTIAASGLRAQSVRVATSASNLANLNTIGPIAEEGGSPSRVFVPQETVFEATDNGGVRAQVIDRPDSVGQAFIPDSIFANADGLVAVPEVSLAEEVINLKIAEIAYRANASVIRTSIDLQQEALDTLA